MINFQQGRTPEKSLEQVSSKKREYFGYRLLNRTLEERQKKKLETTIKIEMLKKLNVSLESRLFQSLENEKKIPDMDDPEILLLEKTDQLGSLLLSTEDCDLKTDEDHKEKKLKNQV